MASNKTSKSINTNGNITTTAASGATESPILAQLWQTGSSTALPHAVTGQTYYDGNSWFVYSGNSWDKMFNNVSSFEDGHTSEIERSLHIMTIYRLRGQSQSVIDLYNSYVEYLVSLKFYYVRFCTDLGRDLESLTDRLSVISKFVNYP